MPTSDPGAGGVNDLQQIQSAKRLPAQVDTDLSRLSVRELIMDLTHLAYPGAYPSLTVSESNAADFDVTERLLRERAVVAELRGRRTGLRR